MAKTSAAKRSTTTTTITKRPKVQKPRAKPAAVVSHYGLRSRVRQAAATKASAPKATSPSPSPAADSTVSPTASTVASKCVSEYGKASESSAATSVSAEEDWKIVEAALILIKMSKEALEGSESCY